MRRAFRVKPWHEKRKARTPAQEAATQRSFQIFRLRGLYSFALLLTGPRRDLMQRLIDEELQLLGAEPQTLRQARERASYALDRLLDALEPIEGAQP